MIWRGPGVLPAGATRRFDPTLGITVSTVANGKASPFSNYSAKKTPQTTRDPHNWLKSWVWQL